MIAKSMKLRVLALLAGVSLPVLSHAADLPIEALPSVTAELSAQSQAVPGATQDAFGIDLSKGGRIWAVEDPNPGVPELSVSSTGLVPFENGAVTQPVNFAIRSNYSHFVRKMEISVYRATDTDLIAPLAVIPIEPKAYAQVQWDGQVLASRPLRAGDDLVYVLRAYGPDGERDETLPNRMTLSRPEDVQRQLSLLRTSYERATGITSSVEEAVGRTLTQNVFSGNNLRLQNIPINASRVQIMGIDIPRGQSIKIEGQSYPVDQNGRLLAEFLLPLGDHNFDIEVGGGSQAESYELSTTVSGDYFYAVGIADVTIHQSRTSGAGAATVPNRDEDVLADGRLAFYGKARFAERYLLTAQMDTTQRELDRMFNDFGRAYPSDVFRRLDPDLYYPTYGDDSQTYRDVDTQGRMYLRLDWAQNQALWGNYQTGLDGSELSQFNRALYGAALKWRSSQSNRWGEATTQVRAFGSEAQTLPGRSEFLGTGGSLYYLRHQDILPGSERVFVEVVDSVSGRIEGRVPLLRGTDYELDDFQGRLILNRPLAQIAQGSSVSIVRNEALEGMTQRLSVDYEWVPSSFDPDGLTLGLRAKHWLGDHLGIGGTYVTEARAGQDYSLKGADITLRMGEGTYLKAEYAETESLSAPSFFSTNGGLSFDTQATGLGTKGDAKMVEGRVNFAELGLTDLQWTAGAWWRETSEGYSTSLYTNPGDTTQYGAEVLGELSTNIELYLRYSRNEAGSDSVTQAQALLDWRINLDSSLTAEVRRVEELYNGNEGAGLLGAVRYTRRLVPGLEVFAQAQLTLDNDDGAYRDNDRYMLGGQYNLGNRSVIGAEVSRGDRGDAFTINAEYQVSNNRSFYGRYTSASDDSDFHPILNRASANGWTLGQRSRLSNRLNLYNESQYLKERGESGLVHTVGLDFYPARGWSTGISVQDGELTNPQGGVVDRFAVSGRLGYNSTKTEWQSKLEWREDQGVERRQQWVTTNRVTHKFNESLRLAGRFNYSETEDELDPNKGAKFVEGNVGFAYRPWDNTRWGLFGRYTYLYDQASPGQVGGIDYDQRSHVFNAEGVYQIDQRWEVAAKLGYRLGEVRLERGRGAG